MQNTRKNYSLDLKITIIYNRFRYYMLNAIIDTFQGKMNESKTKVAMKSMLKLFNFCLIFKTLYYSL